ncbi:SGNH hydrolase-type esterase domain-containing protein [Pelagophyceae sp. CCMP2097]|nr:SGNH hydrolase-type esterase domain-containing protein [Pelagophyceae sp. CCMP2097]
MRPAHHRSSVLALVVCFSRLARVSGYATRLPARSLALRAPSTTRRLATSTAADAQARILEHERAVRRLESELAVLRRTLDEAQRDAGATAAPVRLGPSGTRALGEASPRPLVLIVGSSVALGSGASSAAASWAGRLAAALAARDVEVRNAAVGGTETAYALGRLQAVAPACCRPHVVFASLSLANEGLLAAADGAARRAVGNRFVVGVQRLARHATGIGAGVVVGTAYPHARYDATHAAEVRRVNADLEALAADGGALVDFHAAAVATDGATWAAGASADDGHPNDDGHDRFFRAIDVDALAALAFDRFHRSAPADDLDFEKSARALL